MAKPPFKRVEEIFHRATALAVEERPDFLDTACAGDAELRVAIEELLRHDQDDPTTDALLAGPVARAAEQIRSGNPKLADELVRRSKTIAPIPPQIPGYELLEELGRGGMGVVYKAREVSLDRVVALKMLLPVGQDQPETFARFRTEAESLARLHHPNIVSIYHIDEFEGRPYFTMEFVAGPSLARLLNGRPQDIFASASLIEVLARAVHAVHERGIIHRDLKPANLLLQIEQQDNPLQSAIPKITDFGLAKDRTMDRRLTQAGMTMGTPCYMAPEQARGRAVLIGPASDIYALGSILYEMLTGRPPFDAETSAETITQLLNEEPLSPSSLRPRLPRDLVTICLKCLEKSPRKRYASALDLAEDLRSFQASEPIRARPVGFVERIYRWCQRKPVVAGLLGLIGLLSTAFIVTIIVYDFKLQAEVKKERQQIIQLNIIIGGNEESSGDHFGALLRYTEALKLEDGDIESQRFLRGQIARELRRCPRLVGLLSLDRPIIAASVDPAKRLLAAVDGSNFVQICDAQNGLPYGWRMKHADKVAAGSLSPDGRLLATRTDKGSVRIWNLGSGKSHELPSIAGVDVRHFAFHSNGRLLLTQHANASVRVWNLTGEEPSLLERPTSDVVAFSALSENAQWLFSLDIEQNGRVWNVGTGKTTSPALKLPKGVSLGSLSADGRWLALVGPANAVSVWDVAAGKTMAVPLQLGETVTHIEFSPDCKHVFTSCADGSAHLWHVEAGKARATWLKCDSTLLPARFSPDGGLLLINHRTGVARIWDTRSGQAVSPPLMHSGNLAAVRFSADSKQVMLVGRNGTVSTWEMPENLGSEEPLPDQRPIKELVELAQVLACGQIDATQERTLIEPKQLQKLWEHMHPSR